MTINKASILPSLRLAFLAALAFVAVACSALPVPGVVGTLVVVETRGGHCINPPCGSRIAIESDGRVHEVAPETAELGTAPSDVMAALSAAIRAADFAAIRSHPFTGECPVNFDGQEVVYEFSRLGSTETIASCTVEVDPTVPVFAAVEAALAAAR
ncbi:MAG: hypothetical protein AABZ33_14105 [Chloroflexota bacterium]